jgi:pimeloyl-ACP methyl ester carboxylesterase
MINPRRYGSAPFRVAVVHGGPGAAGEMAAVAHELCSDRGVLEPLQTERSLQAQVEELKGQLREHADPPVTLIGFSWGAWLSLILAAQYPDFVDRLILIGSGPFQESYVPKIMETRLSRLSGAEGEEAKCLIAALQDQNDTLDEAKKQEKNRAMVRMGELFRKTDAFDPIEIKATQFDSIGNDSILPDSGYDNSIV